MPKLWRTAQFQISQRSTSFSVSPEAQESSTERRTTVGFTGAYLDTERRLTHIPDLISSVNEFLCDRKWLCVLFFFNKKGANVFRKNYLTDGHCFFKTRFLVTGGLRESSRKFM